MHFTFNIMVWIANMEIVLDPKNNVINRLRCISNCFNLVGGAKSKPTYPVC